jgi:hypothetical protein
MGEREFLVRVVSHVPFPEIAEDDIIEFPREPPPDTSPSLAVGLDPRECEQCPVCGEDIPKGTLASHMNECLADC